jgi:uncharacterized membrane protein YedE/YeeE
MGVFGALGVALFAAAITLISAARPNWGLPLSFGIAGLGLFVSAGMCMKAMAPVDFLPPGARPSSMFRTDVSDYQRFRAALINLTELSIAYNAAVIPHASTLFARSLYVALGSILFGMGVFIAWLEVYRPFRSNLVGSP